MTTKTKKFLIPVVLVAPIIVVAGWLAWNARPLDDYMQTAFDRLRIVRDNKKRQVMDYFNQTREIALSAGRDEKMVAFFDHLASESADETLELEVDVHYVRQYGNFYDILFVDQSGLVFHSIKKESDYRTRLFSQNRTNSRLGQALLDNPETFFVDYTYYDPSGEPAAFFIVPVKTPRGRCGWFILQCAINRVNAILMDRAGLGRTGEVYLVNHKKLMLTDSRFMEDSTILRLKIETKAVREVMENGSGERIIDDYRGVCVFSVYDRFYIFDTTWIIIAEMDEREVLTDYYQKHHGQLESKLAARLNAGITPAIIGSAPEWSGLRVDMNEYARASPGQKLKTLGVSTCTAVAVSFEREFGYLVHLAPTENVYVNTFLPDLWRRESDNDFLGQLINRIIHYNIVPAELHKLRFVIIAPHLRSLDGIVDKILKRGLELSNIKVMHLDQARTANVYFEPGRGRLLVEWITNKGVQFQLVDSTPDLGEVLKQIV